MADGYEPRAAFYTENRGKKQKIIAHVVTTVRKNFQLKDQQGEIEVKKNWKSGEELT
jgi:hypothetical protein